MQQLALRMISILGLRTQPVAVNFYGREGQTRPVSTREKLRYCQALMKARRGEEILLTSENLSCPAAAAAFGFRPLPEKISGGEMLVALGLFADPQAAARTMASMPRLAPGTCEAVGLGPLAEATMPPDVVVVEAEPEQLMWLALASLFHGGGRLSAVETGVFQATCVDATVVPYLKQKLNFCLGCYGCREASDIGTEEAVLGFPGNQLEGIVAALAALGEKALPRARAKGVYRQLAAREERDRE